MNDATRLFGATLGVAVIGSISASLYAARLAATIPTDLPAQAVADAKGSVGGALLAAQGLQHAGQPEQAVGLALAATNAFLHSFSWSLRVAGLVAFGGAVLAATLLPSRPRRDAPADGELTEVVSVEPADESIMHVELAQSDEEPG